MRLDGVVGKLTIQTFTLSELKSGMADDTLEDLYTNFFTVKSSTWVPSVGLVVICEFDSARYNSQD